jgi:hypothetical protein
MHVVRALLAAGADVHLLYHVGAVFMGMYCNAMQVVRALLAAGADVHLPWASGSMAGASVLQTAACFGKVGVLKLLIGAVHMRGAVCTCMLHVYMRAMCASPLQTAACFEKAQVEVLKLLIGAPQTNPKCSCSSCDMHWAAFACVYVYSM